MKNENTFENWNPDGFARDAQYQRTIRAFSADLICGDVLDVGCGSRIYYNLKNANSWTGVDISQRMLDGIDFRLSGEIDERRIMQGDVLDLPFETESHDTVVACFLLHHLAKDNKRLSAERVQLAFDEFFRVLRPGGRLVVAENCRGPLEIPYHLFFSPIYYLALKLRNTEMPYFWKPKHYVSFSRTAGFQDKPLYVHIPIVEGMYQPVTRIVTPPILNSELIQKMTLFEFVKPE